METRNGPVMRWPSRCASTCRFAFGFHSRYSGELAMRAPVRVLTGICLITPDDRVRLKIVDTRVRFKRLSREVGLI